MIAILSENFRFYRHILCSTQTDKKKIEKKVRSQLFQIFCNA